MEIERFIYTFDKSKNIKLSNRLVEAKYKLSLIEIKIVLAFASQISKSGQRFESVRASAAALINFCGLSKKNGYSLLKAACCSLRSQVIQIKLKDGSWYKTGFFDLINYHDGVIDFKFNEGLKEYLLNVAENYSLLSAKTLCTFNKYLAIRLYMLIKNEKHMVGHKFYINFIRERLMLPQSYTNITHFKNKFLDACIAEINAKSDININYELFKAISGNAYEKVKFNHI